MAVRGLSVPPGKLRGIRAPASEARLDSTAGAPWEDRVLRRAITCLALSLVAAGPAHAAPPAERRFGDWTVGVMAKGEGAYAATVNDSGGLLGLYCYREQEQCVWLLANDLQCQDESRYPVLVNSDAGAFSTVIVCMKLRDRPRYAFADFDEIDGAVLKADWLGLAFPLESGKFSVSRFSLKGSKDAVTFLRKFMDAAIEKAQGTRDQSL